jgi:archaetidylinositol phosphate synthase
MEQFVGMTGWLNMLDNYRKNIDFIFDPIARRISLQANSLTYFSLLFAFFAGISALFSFEVKLLLLAAALFTILNGLFDALDGKIARMRGEAGEKGDFIDHAIDRFADSLLIGALVISPWIHTYIGVPAVLMVILVSYLGTQAQAIGYKRVYAGLLGRADRIVILFFAFIIQFFIQNKIFDLYLLEWVLIYFIIAGIITIIQRYYSVLQWFAGR